MGDLACPRPGARLGGQRVVDPDGPDDVEVPSMLQKAGRHREERRDSYPPGKPTSNANCQFRRVRVSWEVSIMPVELQRAA